MSGIQASSGLISGIDIAGTVDQLIAIAARPRDRLVSRTDKLSAQQAAVTDLTTKIIGLELSAERLSGENSVFKNVRVKSSNDAISARSTGSPQIGNFQVTPVRRAQTNQLLSETIADGPLGEGSISFQTGGHVQTSVELKDLNGGRGVDSGKIQLTDRSGNTATIDLSVAKTIDDVVEAINNQSEANVTASLVGDRIELKDNTGQTTSNLKVQNVGRDTTATDLGLAGIDVGSDSASGGDIYFLSRNTELSGLNNGNGVGVGGGNDLQVSLRDGGANVDIDLSGASTVGDVLDRINTADPARVRAEINASGDGIDIIDLTAGAGTFQVSDATGSSAATDLGINGTGPSGTITGSRVQAGLDTVLLNRLNGGQGIGQLGEITITDRSGSSANIDLSSAETLDDVLKAINDNGSINVRAEVNETGTGFALVDLSGGSGSLTVANTGDGTDSADKLKIAGSTSNAKLESEPLNLQSVSRNTKLEDFRGGIELGSFLIKDTNGNTAGVNLRVLEAETVGDVLDAINSLSIDVTATINEAGNGISITDTGGGTENLTITDSGNGTAGADLGIAGSATDVDGVVRLEGSSRQSIEISDTDTLEDLVEKINSSNVGVKASRLFDGEGYRLSLISENAGASNRIWLDSDTLDTDFQTAAKAQDSLLRYGPADSQASLLLSSDSNTFGQIVPEVEISIDQATGQTVDVTVERNEESVVDAVQLFVDQFNGVFTSLAEYTSFSSSATSSGTQIDTGLLFGSSEALRVEQELTRLATGRFSGAGEFSSLREIGIEYDFENQQLKLDENKFREAFTEDPEGVREFFEAEDFGVSARFQDVTDRLAGIDNSVLINRNKTLQNQIDNNNARITEKNETLDRQRTRLLLQFYRNEETLSRLQEGQTAIASIQPIPPVTSSSR